MPLKAIPAFRGICLCGIGFGLERKMQRYSHSATVYIG